MKKYILILLHLLFLIPLAHSQNQIVTQNDVEKYVMTLFDKPSKVEWLRSYRGRIEDVNEVNLTIASDGVSCKGQMIYARSKENFRLEGTLERDGTLKLQEIDNNDMISGYLRGIVNNRYIKAEWTNTDNSIGCVVILSEILQDFRPPPTSCGDNKWIDRYRGVIDNSEVEMILQKGNNGHLRGIAYLKNDKKSYQIKGLLEDGQLNLNLKDSHGVLRGNLRGKYMPQQEIRGTFSSPDKKNALISFSLEESLNVGCIEYADYFSSYDVTFPKTKNEIFNKWIGDKVNDWVEGCDYKVRKVKIQQKDKVPALRLSTRAYAWCDIDFYNKNLISGFITFQTTWKPGQEGEGFTFDLKDGKLITLQDIFEEKIDYKIVINNFIQREIRKNVFYKTDEDFKAWVEKQDFPYFTLRREGITFFTRTNSIYGKQAISIDYNELKPFFKKNTPVASLVEK